jgi:hypothetical protein
MRLVLGNVRLGRLGLILIVYMAWGRSLGRSLWALELGGGGGGAAAFINCNAEKAVVELRNTP